MSENNSTQTWPIRVSSLSNFLLGGLVAGCLVIGIAYLVERGKRTAIEEQFFTEVKELPAHEVEEIIKNAILKIMSESKKVENELLSDQKVAGVSNPEYGVESCVAPMELTTGGLSVDKESVLGKLITLSPKDYVAILFSSSKVMAFSTIYSNGFRSDQKKLSESEEVKEELLSDRKEAIKSSGSSLKSLTAKIGIKNKCSKCDELMAKRESIERDIRAKTPGLRFVKN